MAPRSTRSHLTPAEGPALLVLPLAAELLRSFVGQGFLSGLEVGPRPCLLPASLLPLAECGRLTSHTLLGSPWLFVVLFHWVTLSASDLKLYTSSLLLFSVQY